MLGFSDDEITKVLGSGTAEIKNDKVTVTGSTTSPYDIYGRPKAIVDPSDPSGDKAKNKPRANPATDLGNILAGSISAYFDVMMQGGSSGEAGRSAKQNLARGLVGLAQKMAGGGIAGALLGGLAGWGISALFGLNKPQAVKHEAPKFGQLFSPLEFMQMFSLPSSGYFQPTGRNTGPVQFYQNNQINVTGGAKVATRLQSALTDPELLSQLNRGLV